MNFFCTERDFDEWVSKMQVNKDEIYKLSVEEAIEVSYELFDFR